ncbi:hypothetical protein GCM10010246_26480 [Streptomyces cuspidosporus]|uniref:Uncharacterized protein n=1 Tax=Streptomyces cuspidosporus TaxID=66882 RepID=A0ABN3FY71_9ACTN
MKATRLRLLPWPGPNGQRAYTPDDCPDGRIARLADRVEAEQLSTAEAVLSLSRGMLGTGLPIEPDECTYLMKRLSECLEDMIRVAESRGGRLPEPNPLDAESESLEGQS